MHRLTEQLNVRFEERLAERTRIAQELHDTLLQGFLSASMQLHVAAEQVPEDSRARHQLTRVLNLITRVIDDGRRALRGLRTVASSSLDLEEALSRLQHEFAADTVTFKLTAEGEARPLHPLIRDEVYSIGREALANAFRHSGAHTIETQIRYTSQHLRLTVKDDGCGIDSRVLRSGRDGHWGLQGMRERADRIKAELHVWSKEDNGTEVELSVPAHVAFGLKNSNRSWLLFGKRRYWKSRNSVEVENGKTR